MHRFARASLLLGGVFIGAILLILLAYFVEARLGRNEWNRVRAEMEARGETFKFADLAPPLVPDDQNFAMTPLLRPLLDYELDPATHEATWRDPAAKKRADDIKLSDGTTKLPLAGDWRKGETADLAAWADYFREAEKFDAPEKLPPAETVLAALKKFEPELDEIARAAQRPYGRFPVHHEEGAFAPLPHVNVLLNTAKILSLRASAHLAGGNPEAALADVQLNLRIQWLLRDELTLINHLVLLSAFHVTMQPVWEGLAARSWTDPQLAKIEKSLSRIDLLSNYHRAFCGEIAFSAWMYDFVRKDPAQLATLWAISGRDKEYNIFRIMPRGMVYRNQAWQTRVMFDELIPTMNPEQHRVSVGKLNKLDETTSELQSRTFLPNRFLALMSLPVYRNVTIRAAESTDLLDLARVAIALERHRLAHGGYPANLDALAPRFLTAVPHDIITGEPLKYRVRDGAFILYSVGWNETDDGGELGLEKNGRNLDREKGDWVWPQSRQTAPDPA